MKKRFLLLLIVGALIALPFQAGAALFTFSDQATFLAATGAVSATGAYDNLGSVPSPYTSGSVTLSLGPRATQLVVGGAVDWTTRLAGNDIAISQFEDLNAAFAAPVYAAGFDFVEPEKDPNLNEPFFDSTFTVTVKNGANSLGSFSFNAPNDAAAFVGVRSDLPFDLLEIRETVGGIGNEFFGQFYTGSTPAPVPLPPGLLLVGSGLLGLIGFRRKFLK